MTSFEKSAGLFVGVSAYDDRTIAPVPFAVDDAIDLAHLFALELSLIRPTKIRLCLSGPPKKEESQERLAALAANGASVIPATMTNIYRSVDELAPDPDCEDFFLFTYAGHGLTDQGAATLLGQDTVRRRPVHTGINFSTILDDISQSQAKTRLLLIDACRARYSGATRSPQKEESVPQTAAYAEFRRLLHESSEGLPGGGTAVLTVPTVAFDDPSIQNGVFSGLIIEVLRSLPPPSSSISLQELADAVNRGILNWAAKNRPTYLGTKSLGVLATFDPQGMRDFRLPGIPALEAASHELVPAAAVEPDNIEMPPAAHQGIQLDEPTVLLHLSDLHFLGNEDPRTHLEGLLTDLQLEGFLKLPVNYVAVTGDFTDQGRPAGFDVALRFLKCLAQELKLPADRFLLVPGNHDIVDRTDCFDWTSVHPTDPDHVVKSDIFLVPNELNYRRRFEVFSQMLHEPFLGFAYPLEYREQAFTTSFWGDHFQFFLYNSSWQIDQFRRKRSGIHPDAVANSIRKARETKQTALEASLLSKSKPLIRIAMWHHAVAGPEQIQETAFLDNLKRHKIKIALHGDVHEMRCDFVGYRHEAKLHVIGAGSFGAGKSARPDAVPRLYNVLEFSADRKQVRVHTRCQRKQYGAWEGWPMWASKGGGEARYPFFDIDLVD